jgi:pyruvate,water dikinase
MGTFVKKFEAINKEMFQECGGKASHLGELTSLKLNVPKGFCVLAEAFSRHLKHNHLDEQITEIAQGIHYDDFQDLEQKTSKIRSLIENAEILPEIEEEIIENYQNLLEGETEPFVAVRSSVAVKGSSISSFPGMMDTFHYLRGSGTVIANVRRCWASVWSARAASTRQRKGIEHSKAIIAPIVQNMVNSRAAGVIFTLNPLNGDPSKIVIEGSWGLGESVVSGAVTPDKVVVDKVVLEINERIISPKNIECVYDPEKGKVVHAQVASDLQNKPCLDDEEIKELVRLAKCIEEHYGCPQDIEWAIDRNFPFPNNIFILQSRAESVWSQKKKEPVLGKKSGYELLMEKALTRTKTGFKPSR